MAAGGWTRRLGAEVRDWLPLNLWEIVAGYRDLLWACVAPFSFENDEYLTRFLTALQQLVDGIIVVLDPRSTIGGEKLDADAFVRRLVKADFKQESVVIATLNDELPYSYSRQMNGAIKLLDWRCHFFLELQTREIPTVWNLFALKTALLKQKTSFRVGHRALIFPLEGFADTINPCQGSANSFIRVRDLNSTVFLDNSVVEYESHLKEKSQILLDISAMKRDSEASENRSRALFYIASSYASIKETQSAKQAFEAVLANFFRGERSWSQELYLSALELMHFHGEPFNAKQCFYFAHLAMSCDNRRVDALCQSMRIARQQLVTSNSLEAKEFALQVEHLVLQYCQLINHNDAAAVRFQLREKFLPFQDCLFPRFRDVDFWFELAWFLVNTPSRRLEAYAAANTYLLENGPGRRTMARLALRLLPSLFPRAPPIPHLLKAIK